MPRNFRRTVLAPKGWIPKPILDTNFLNDGYLAQLGGNPWTYARNTSGTVYGPDGTIQSVAANVLPITYDPVTLQRQGFLAQDARTNLWLQSTAMTNAPWSLSAPADTAVSAETGVSPAGTDAHFKLYEASATAGVSHAVIQQITVTSGQAYTLDIVAKAAERSQFLIALPTTAAFSAAPRARFDLIAGTATVATAGNSLTAAIEPLGSGWYHCVVTAVASGSAPANVLLRVLNSSQQELYAGTVGAGLLLTLPNASVGTFPTSPIPTTSAQVTRSADLLSITGDAFSSIWNPNGGTLLFRYKVIGIGDSTTANGITLSDGSGNNRVYLHPRTDGKHSTGIFVGGVSVGGATVNEMALGVTTCNVVSFSQQSGFVWAKDGIVIVDQGLSAVPPCNKLNVGLFNGSIAGSKAIERIAYWPKPLSPAQLARASKL